MLRSTLVGTGAILLAGTACNAVLGNEDLVFDLDRVDDAAVDGAVVFEGGPQDGGPLDASASSCTGNAACERIVFVTSEGFQGDLQGIDGADKQCQRLADSPGSVVKHRRFLAWLSDDHTTPKSRLVHGTKPYRRTDGLIVAPNWDVLVSRMIVTAIDQDETGNTRLPTDVWTGTLATGDLHSPTCDGWLNASPTVLGSTGRTDSTVSTWTSAADDRACSNTNAIFCIEY
jgi:hypothetical protein